ncbi:hypothetical protein AB0H12_22310 [Actinosynnema sp. NPDC023794]
MAGALLAAGFFARRVAQSAVATLDSVTAKVAARGVDAGIVDLNGEQPHSKLTGQVSGSR